MKQLFSVFLFFISLTAYSQEPGNLLLSPGDDFNAEQIIEQNKAALISIWYKTSDFYSPFNYSYTKDTTILNGSGFIVSPEGLVASNFHVIDGIDSILIKTSDGTFYNAELMLIDEKNDLALLKIINKYGLVFPTVKLGNSDEVKVGANVYAIGSPLGFEYTISEGIVAAVRPEEKVTFNDPISYAPIERVFDKVIQITAAISPGNSGGALFNGRGEVIGLTTYSYGFYGNLNFAIGINSFKALHESAVLGIDSADFIARKTDNQFNINYKLAGNFKSKLYYNWYYSKWVDTAKTLDTFAVRQDSLNQITLQKAEGYYSKAIELKPDTFTVYSELLDLYIFTENYKKAEDFYINIKEQFSDSDSLLNSLSSALANAYTSSKDYKKALTFYQKVLYQDTNDISIRYQIANTYEKMGDQRTAIKNYRDIIKRDSGYTQAYVQIAGIYYNRGELERAKEYLMPVYEREISGGYYSSSVPDLHYYLGMIAVQEGRKLDAILSFMELKQTYTYTPEDTEKKIKLYKAIKEIGE